MEFLGVLWLLTGTYALIKLVPVQYLLIIDHKEHLLTDLLLF